MRRAISVKLYHAVVIWLILVLMMLLAPGVRSSALAKPLIRLLEEATIDGDTIRLADIAVVEGQDQKLVSALNRTVIGKAPLPGKSRRIDASYVTIRLKQRGIDPRRVSLNSKEVTSVYRDGIVITPEALRSAIEDAMHRENFWQGRQAIIRKIRVQNDLIVPPGVVSYQIDFPDRSVTTTRIPVMVTLRVDDNVYKKFWVTILVDVLQEAVVLKRPVRKHQQLKKDDIRFVTKALSEIPSNAITRHQDIIGKRVTKSMLSGTILRSDLIESPPLVKRGDVVTIVVSSGNLKVTALGKVKNTGRKGERIRVINIDTEKELYGYLLDAKTVQVIF